MSLRLQIENVGTLPDGGPLGITVTGRRGIDIGRDQHLDWTLPDPSRFISGKHCEIRFQDGAYWLHDVSINGTYVNGSDDPVRGPHRLRAGDKIEIGPYIVAVEVEEAADPGAVEGAQARPRTGADLWHVDDVAPPAEPERRRMPVPDQPAADPFLDAPFEPFRLVREAAAPRQTSSADLGWGASGDIWSDDPQRASPPAAPPPAAPAPRPSLAPPEAGPAAASGNAASAELVRAFAQGAGVPEAVFARYSPAELATLMGHLVRLSADNLKQLLAARSELKDLIRSSQTVVTTQDNNPLKLAPTLDEALALMFAPPSASYLDASAAFQQGFKDIRHHQVQTFSAMQVAVSALGRDLEPTRIEAEVETERGLGAMVSSRKARLWDAYVTSWKARVGRHEDGLLGVFLEYFSEHYGRASGRRGS